MVIHSVVQRPREEGNGELLLNGSKVSTEKDFKNALEMVMIMTSQCSTINATESGTLKMGKTVLYYLYFIARKV